MGDVAARKPLFGGADPVRIENDRTAKVTIEEAEGRVVMVRVLDEEGLPLAGAKLAIQTADGMHYTLLTGKTQRFGIHTDPDGRAVLPHVADGPVKVTATYGTRSASGTEEWGGFLELRMGAKTPR